MNEPLVAGSWHPVTLHEEKNQEEMERALCAGFNSTLGVLTLLSVAGHKLPYPAIKTVPLFFGGSPHVPDVREASIRKPLVAVQKAYEKSPL
ncbi:MAG: hypothetical protein OXB93_00260 [Cytophagales bacterium]|nr:hypothetical protein [Cytophagales bacterium]